MRLQFGIGLIGDAADTHGVARGRARQGAFAFAVKQMLGAAALIAEGAVRDMAQQPRGILIQARIDEPSQPVIAGIGLLPGPRIVSRHGRNVRAAINHGHGGIAKQRQHFAPLRRRGQGGRCALPFIGRQERPGEANWQQGGGGRSWQRAARADRWPVR